MGKKQELYYSGNSTILRYNEIPFISFFKFIYFVDFLFRIVNFQEKIKQMSIK